MSRNYPLSYNTFYLTLFDMKNYPLSYKVFLTQQIRGLELSQGQFPYYNSVFIKFRYINTLREVTSCGSTGIVFSRLTVRFIVVHLLV